MDKAETTFSNPIGAEPGRPPKLRPRRDVFPPDPAATSPPAAFSSALPPPIASIASSMLPELPASEAPAPPPKADTQKNPSPEAFSPSRPPPLYSVPGSDLPEFSQSAKVSPPLAEDFPDELIPPPVAVQYEPAETIEPPTLSEPDPPVLIEIDEPVETPELIEDSEPGQPLPAIVTWEAAPPMGPPGPIELQPAAGPSSLSRAISRVAGDTPPWLVSLVFHLAVLILLALLTVSARPEWESIILQLGDGSEEERLDTEPFELPSLEARDDQIVVTPPDLEPVDDPLAAPAELEMNPDAMVASPTIQAPVVGLALSGRRSGSKEMMLAIYGGDATTEAAVGRGLEWLRRRQTEDGSWSLQGPYEDGSPFENRVAATAMAMLAFQGAGHTHKEGPYARNVVLGLKALEKYQNPDGSFWPNEAARRHETYGSNHRMYSHAQATIAICELYGMTRDEKLHEPARRAVDYAVQTQDRQGGWRYAPGNDSDTSVTGWMVMALQSAKMSGLNVPDSTLEGVSNYLDSAASEGGSLYGYRPGERPTMSMTAEGLLCRQYLDWRQNDPRLVEGAALLLTEPIDPAEQNVYSWYYATQVLHHMEGEYWRRWNETMRREIPKMQQLEGREIGSWDPKRDAWGRQAGRLYTTCLSIYMLEVYYRHLPIYADPFR